MEMGIENQSAAQLVQTRPKANVIAGRLRVTYLSYMGVFAI
jgi:hypothetical protein